MPFITPPPIVAAAPQTLPPLSFEGFRAGMLVADARAKIVAGGGRLSCKATTDQRMKDCTGTLPAHGALPAFELLISSIKDSSAVIVFSTSGSRRFSTTWVKQLTESFGRPNHDDRPKALSSWQWIRQSRMLRVVERKKGVRWEASVTLTHGPLLDGLGRP